MFRTFFNTRLYGPFLGFRSFSGVRFSMSQILTLEATEKPLKSLRPGRENRKWPPLELCVAISCLYFAALMDTWNPELGRCVQGLDFPATGTRLTVLPGPKIGPYSAARIMKEELTAGKA